MKHSSLLVACAALALLLAPGPRASAANVSISLRIGDPYRGPRLAFASRPDFVLIPGTRVYYVDDYDYDLYRYGGYWYYYYDGGWYRSVDYDGPFYFISYVSVPTSIRYVPTRYRHHWRSYRGPAYSYYQAGRYYRSRPSNTTSYRTPTDGRSSTTRYSRRTADRRYGRERGSDRRQAQPVQQERYQRERRHQEQASPRQQKRDGENRGGGHGQGGGKGGGHGQGEEKSGGHGRGHGG